MCSEWLLCFFLYAYLMLTTFKCTQWYISQNVPLLCSWDAVSGFQSKRAQKTQCRCLSHTCWPPEFYGLTLNKQLQHFKLLNHSLQSLQKMYFLQCPLVYNFPFCFAFFFILLLFFPVHLFTPVPKGHILW